MKYRQFKDDCGDDSLVSIGRKTYSFGSYVEIETFHALPYGRNRFSPRNAVKVALALIETAKEIDPDILDDFDVFKGK